jgi:hypothetical protein
MSIETIANQITSIDRDINNLEREMQNLDTDIIRKNKDASAIMEKMSREKDFKKLATLSKDLARKNDEINNLEKRKTPKSKLLADKQKKKRELIISLNKEEKKERDKSKNDQKELLSIQQKITREIEARQRLSLQSLDRFIPSNIVSFDEIAKKHYDVFISHASEDKDDFVRPFATLLRDKGLVVWYDEFELKIGDKLRRKIDEGLNSSRYGIVVLSNSFFSKEWPQKELDGLFAIEDGGRDVILPIWHKISKNEVLSYSPTIATILALNTLNFTIEEIAEKIVEKVNS